MTGLFLFIFGLFWGSFLNVIIYRLKAGEQFVKGRSKCPHCSHEILARDLIPLISFLLLKGKCRFCQRKISLQYPVMELVSGLIFLIGYFYFLHNSVLAGKVEEFFVYIVFASFLLLIFVYDLKYYLIPDKISLPAFMVALLLNFWQGFSLLNLILASIIIAGFFFLQFIVSKGKWIGGGDIRLGLVMGAMLGWPVAMAGLFLAYLAGAVLSIILVSFKKKQWSSQLPFGTFLTAGTFVCLLYGRELVKWYLSLF